MKQYITTLSKHCYYGNVTSILNHLGLTISEAELVLLSGGLNCSCVFEGERLYWRIPIELCYVGLDKLGIEIVTIEDRESIHNISIQDIPILVKIRASFLNYNYIFNGSPKNHYIVIVNERDSMFLISDSFIPTIPLETYQGAVEVHKIYDAIIQKYAKSYTFVIKEKPKNTLKMSRELFLDYLKKSAVSDKNSVIDFLHYFSKIALENINLLLNKEALNEMAYDLRYSGAIARFDYVIYFIDQFCTTVQTIKTDLLKLKTKWELLINKIMKCAITLNEQYYVKIFSTEISELIKCEVHIYRNVLKQEGSFIYE